MNFEDIISAEFKEAKNLLETIINQPAMIQQINQAAHRMAQAIGEGHKIISCGNGGSHCDAMHFAEELTGKYREERRSFPAIAISDASHITCAGNDYGFEHIFSRYIEGVGQEGDVLLALTTSGNSANILQAVKAGTDRKMFTVVLSGKDGGRVRDVADICIVVPHDGFSDRIQEIHIKIIHIFILLIEKILN